MRFYPLSLPLLAFAIRNIPRQLTSRFESTAVRSPPHQNLFLLDTEIVVISKPEIIMKRFFSFPCPRDFQISPKLGLSPTTASSQNTRGPLLYARTRQEGWRSQRSVISHLCGGTARIGSLVVGAGRRAKWRASDELERHERTMATGGDTEKLTAKGKERAIFTKVGKRSDDGWENRGWKFTEEELLNPPSLRDNM